MFNLDDFKPETMVKTYFEKMAEAQKAYFDAVEKTVATQRAVVEKGLVDLQAAAKVNGEV